MSKTSYNPFFDPWAKHRRKPSSAKRLRTGFQERVESINHATNVLQEHGTCCYCNCYLDKETMTVEHLIPLSKGGDNSKANIDIACEKCNGSKKDKTEAEYTKHGTFPGKSRLANIIRCKLRDNEEITEELVVEIAKKVGIIIPRRILSPFLQVCLDRRSRWEARLSIEKSLAGEE